MKIKDEEAEEIRKELLNEVRAIQIFSTSVIFSAAAVASSTVLLLIPNLETLSLFFFLVGYRYGLTTGTTTVLTSVTIFEMFASQIYGTGGPLPFLLKFPPFLLIMIVGVYFHTLKTKEEFSTDDKKDYLAKQGSIADVPILYEPQMVNQEKIGTNFSLYERVLLAQLGLALTIIYDIITSFGILFFVPTWQGLLVSFIAGIPFFILHQVSNLILFSTIPSIITALDKARPSM